MVTWETPLNEDAPFSTAYLRNFAAVGFIPWSEGLRGSRLLRRTASRSV
jgi:hypothetical protein